MVNGLFNTMISETKAVGYCHKHHCCMTSVQLKRKECLNKQCFHLERKEHEYWKQREIVKMKRLDRKVMMKNG